MNLVKQASVVSLFALMTAATASLASAQDSYGEQGNYCAKHPDRCGSQQMQRPDDRSDEEDQGYTKKRRVQVDEDQGQVQQSEEPRRHAQSDWQFDPKSGALSRWTHNANGSLVTLNDILTQGETHARSHSQWFGGKERFKDACL